MVSKWFFVLPVALILVGVALIFGFGGKSSDQIQQRAVTQIYPNYDFPKGVDQIKVPLILINQRLSRQAGGWVIAPPGSRFRFDHDVPVIVENVDGRKTYVQPADVAWIGVEPGNGLLRFYGEEGKFVKVSIKRNFYH